MNTDGVPDIHDFGSEDPVPFTVDGQRFELVADVPLDLVAGLTELTQLDVATISVDKVMVFFERVLVPDSVAPFRAKLADRVRPIGLKRLMKILMWAVEQYAMGPTQESSDSSPSSMASVSGSLTGGAPVVVSIPSGLVPAGPST